MLDADIYMTTISYYYILLTITHRPFKTLLAEVINLLLIVRPTNISEHYLLLIVFKPKITNLKFAYNLGFSLGNRDTLTIRHHIHHYILLDMCLAAHGEL